MQDIKIKTDIVRYQHYKKSLQNDKRLIIHPVFTENEIETLQCMQIQNNMYLKYVTLRQTKAIVNLDLPSSL